MSASSHVTEPKPTATRPAPEHGAAQRSLLIACREPAFLDVDFDATPRPELVTQLLIITEPSSSATSQVDETSIWEQSVGTRLKHLLEIVRDTEGITTFSLRLTCPHEGCRQPLEIDLPLDGLAALHDESADYDLLRFPVADSLPIAFRRPTGDDLRRWHTTPPSAQDVLRSLFVPEYKQTKIDNLPPLEACASAFSEFDILVAFQLSTCCPHCSRESSHAIDLETIAVRRLGRLQQQLFQENHQLAQAYGWSETEIFQVPRKRRLRYLARLEASA